MKSCENTPEKALFFWIDQKPSARLRLEYSRLKVNKNSLLLKALGGNEF